MIELPELPPTLGADVFGADYTASQLRSYGLSCARAAMERAAQICERLRDDHCAAYDSECEADGSDGCEFVAAWNDAAAAIRAEIEKEKAK